jgi:hypothetical protein
MKNPFKKKNPPTTKPSQERQPSTPPAVVKLTAADLEQVQGGRVIHHPFLVYKELDRASPQ